MMKKKPIATMIISFCFAISLVASSIDWNFLDADAQMEIETEDISVSMNGISEAEEALETEEVSGATGEISDEEMPETSDETDDTLFSLSAESDGISAEFFNGHVFLPEDSISMTKLSPGAADKLAESLSGTLSGQTAVPVVGFVIDGEISDMQDSVLDVKLSYPVNENTRLYKCSDEGYEAVKYAVDEEGRLVFQTQLPCTYLFADVAYTEEPINFSYSDEDITVTAVCAAESGIPADAVFCVDKLEEGTDAYKKAYDALLSTIELGKNEELLFAPYDVYFLYDGERMEPETGMVQVNMEFHNDILAADSEGDILGDLFCVHIKEDGEVEKPDSTVSETSMAFEVDTFSVMGAAAVLTDADSTIINACLYSDGTLVYQKTMDTDETHGSIVATYQLDETYDYKYNNEPGYRNNENFRKKVKTVFFQDIYAPVSCYMLFYFPNCTSLDLSNLDTSNVTDMSYMFAACSSLTSLDLSNLDTSNVTKMDSMFMRCNKLTSLDLSNFDTSNVTDMQYMFAECSSLTQLDLSGFNTSNVTDMHGMFSFKLGSITTPNLLVSVDLSNFDTSNVTNMREMFAGCHRIRTLDLSNFDTSNVTSMSGMFTLCQNLISLDISNFDTSRSSKSDVFYYCNGLARIKISEKILAKFIAYTDSYSPFECSWIHVESDTTYSNLFSFCNDKDIYLPAGTYVRPTSIVFDSIYHGTSSVTGCLDMPINELPEPSNDGTRHFLGWFTQKTGGEQLVPGSIITTSRYYAHWADYEYDLILKPNGGNGDDMVKRLGYHETYQLPGAIYEYPGKKLTGWNTRKDGTGKQYAPKDFVKGLSPDDGGTFTLYAQYEDLEEFVTVTFETNGGIELPAMTSAPGGTIKLPIPGRMHYTFDGWSVNENCSDKITSSTYTVSGDIVLYARWIKNPVVTFDAQGNGSNTVREVKYNTAIGSLPKYPTNSERFCSLIGWFTEPEGGTQITSSKAVTKDTTFYAHWGWKPEFDADGGMITSTDTYPMQEGSSLYMIEKLPSCKKDGYTFTGWYHGTLDELLTDGCIVDLSEGSVVTARYEEKRKVTVTFQNNGNSYAYTCIAGESLGAFPKMTAPSKSVTGYGTVYADFAGWTDASGKIYTSSDVFTEDTILTAQWVWKDVILTFDADGGTNISGTGVTNNKMCAAVGSTLFTLPGAKKQNYVLEGWYTEKDGAGEKLTTDTVITESMTYYAHWVSFFLNSSDATSVYNYGAEWSNVSNSNMTNLDDVLEMHPTSNSSQTASLHIRFEINKTVENSENLVLPVGAVKIRFPKYIWKDWNGNNTGSNNLSNSLPKYPNTNSMHFSYMEDGSDYVLINSTELSGTAGLDLTIAYAVTPTNVPGGASDVNGRYVDGYGAYKGDVPVTFTIDSDLDGTAESETVKNLAVEMHTMANLPLSKSGNNVLYHWNTSWGEEPADAEDYFYITWSASWTNNGTQDITNVRYEENECHDGTVVYQNGAQVVTRHPKALLKNAPQNGIKLENTITAHGTMKSGYEISSIARGTKTVPPERYVTDSYRKANNNNGTDSVASVNGGQETILDDKKNITMTWYLNYSGGPDSAPIWDDDLGTYHAGERTIRIRDGVYGDVMYSSGAASSPYVWEPDTGNVILADEDYYFSSLEVLITEFDSVQVDGTWSAQTANTEYNAQDGFDLYVRYAGSDDFVFYGHYDAKSSTHSLSFTGTDIVGFEVRHDSRYYHTTARIKAVMRLKPTNHVRMLLQNDVNKRKVSVIKNSSTCDVWKTADGESSAFFHVTDNTGGNRSSARNCYSLNVSTTTQYTNMSVGAQSNVIFDAAKGTQDTPVRIGAYNSNNSSRTKKMSSGTFYNLLPAGTSVDPDTIFGIPGSSGSAGNYNSYKTSKSRIDPGYFDVRFVQNWEDSGRTMMVITYGLPENHPVTAGIGFYYLLHNTYENVMEHGTSVENDVAFINTTKDRVLPNSISGALSVITQKTYYQKLNDANSGNIGYAKANSSFIPISAYSWGFNKSVQTISEYERRGEVLPNNLYTYRLAYSQSENATCKGLVFFDVLEGGSDVLTENGAVQHNDSEWHGVFQYVNTGAAASKLTNGSTSVYCKPVIYYSTKARDAFTDSDWNVANTDTWSVTKPDNAADITAVAIDCSKNTDGTDFVMKGKQSLDMYITMKAPASTENTGKTAYNEGVVWAVHETDNDPTPQYDNASVIIRDVAPELHKTADPTSGTQANPIDVYEDDELNYTISIKNPDDQFTLNDIIVEDTIPEGLSIDYANIKVHFGNPENAVDVSTSPRVNMTRAARKLKFTISSLMPGETAYITIPTIVTVREGVISNMAYITSVNGINKTTDSETTWHEAYPTVLSIKKTGVGGIAIAGARLQLFDADGNMVSEWVSSEKTEHFDVKPGEYTVHEVEAPDGYLLAEDMDVTLTKNGLIYVNGERISPALMQDDYTKILVDKKGGEGEDVIGAQLEIYELPADYGTDYASLTDDITSGNLGNVVCAWEHTSTKEVFGILKAGYTYVLYEKAAPEGYRKAQPIVFTVNTDGSEQTVTMVDPYMGRDINVWKYGETTDNPLPGASMAIYSARKHVHDYVQVIDEINIDWMNTSNGTKYHFVQNGSKWTSNNKGINSSTASSTWTITLEKETDVLIRYKVSSESGYDKFTLKLDNVALANAISGAGTEKTVTKTLAAGTHTLTASYSKDGSSHKNDDCAYIILNGIHTSKPTNAWKCQICGNEVTEESEAVNGPVYEINEDFEPICWTSGTDAHTVQLDKGTYILREERAPRGWAVYDDIPFSVTLDGKITYETDGNTADELCMIDEPSDEPLNADLSVVKMVEGNMGDKTKAFRFRLSLNDPELTEITRSMRDKTGGIVSDTVHLTDGAYEFTLAHEEWISFILPQDTEYAVTELDGEEDGYTVESVNAEGTIADMNIAVQFTNTKNAGIPTGFIAMTGVTMIIVLSAGVAIIIILWSKAKHKNKQLKEEE